MQSGHGSVTRGSARPRIAWKPCSPDGKVASSRFRAFLPCRYLGRAGWPTGILPPDGHGDYDCVVFQKPYGQADMAFAESLRARGVRVVVDVCDNLFHNPDSLPELHETAVRLERMLDMADAVTVSTPTLADLLAPRSTFHVDDALEMPPGSRRASVRKKVMGAVAGGGRRPVRLVWFGSSGTAGLPYGMAFLQRALPDLERLHRELPLRLTVISDSPEMFSRYVASAALETRFTPWTGATFARAFAGNDICIIPVATNPLTVHKTNNRLVLSLLLRVPVVADVIPSYREFENHVLFGDWAQNVARYAADRALANHHVETGRSYIRSTYTKARVIEQWSAVFGTLFDIH